MKTTLESYKYQISRPFAYLTIQQAGIKGLSIISPALGAAMITFIIFVLPGSAKIFGESSLTSYSIAFLSTLPGFFIAALAAVATFNRDELDEAMPDPAPTIIFRTGDTSAPVDLTSRVFLSFLFAYLTAVSVTALIIEIILNVCAPGIRALALIPGEHVVLLICFLKAAYTFLALWVIGTVFTTMLYGLYFLAERMHRPKA